MIKLLKPTAQPIGHDATSILGSHPEQETAPNINKFDQKETDASVKRTQKAMGQIGVKLELIPPVPPDATDVVIDAEQAGQAVAAQTVDYPARYALGMEQVQLPPAQASHEDSVS